jgi:hypothetical protein
VELGPGVSEAERAVEDEPLRPLNGCGSYRGPRQISTSRAASPHSTGVAAWKLKNFKQMVQLSEQSWRLRSSGAAGVLRAQYGFKDVLSCRFVRCSANNVSARVTFRVKYRKYKVSRVQITAMVIREDHAGNPSALGRWGVNPISTLREIPV